MFLTHEGMQQVKELDSIRAVRVLFQLMELAGINGAVSITQEKLSEYLNLKNRANVNVTLGELISLGLIAKKVEGKKITYFLNPEYFLSERGYSALKLQYDQCPKIKIKIKSIKEDKEESKDFSQIFDNFFKGEI